MIPAISVSAMLRGMSMSAFCGGRKAFTSAALVSEWITGVARDEQQQRHAHADEPGAQSDDEGLGVEHLGDVPAGGADGAEYADLLGALQHGNIGYYADHDAGHHQRDAHKGDEHI
jgi:hypothetical protein